MAAVLVIGYGNPLRSDDGAGWRVADAVRHLQAGDDRVEVLTCHQLLPELAAKMAESDQVIFVDAAEGTTAGEVQHKELNPEQCSGPNNHQVNPASLVQICRDVFGRSPRASIITISAGSLAFGQQLTSTVEQAIASAVRMIEECIGREVRA